MGGVKSLIYDLLRFYVHNFCTPWPIELMQDPLYWCGVHLNVIYEKSFDFPLIIRLITAMQQDVNSFA